MIAKALKGVSFPRSKRDLITHVRQHAARDENVIRVLERLPEREYASMADVEMGVGAVE